MGASVTKKWLDDNNLVEVKPGVFEKKKNTSSILVTEKLTLKEITNRYPLSQNQINELKKATLRKISLCLFGTPMPKQSVRSTKTGHHYQPQKMVDKKKEYQWEIKKQLPEGFTPFENEVHVTKLHFVYPPLKKFHKEKGKMDAIRAGEIFYKNTKSDIDNIQKMIWDSLNGLVMKDDALIVSLNDVKKYYGVGGMIVIEMEGY